MHGSKPPLPYTSSWLHVGWQGQFCFQNCNTCCTCTVIHSSGQTRVCSMIWSVPHEVFTTYFHSKTYQMHQFLKFILFWNNTLHVSDGLYVHHQEFKTVHTGTSICQTFCCLLASGNEMEFPLVPASKQVAVSVWHIPVAVCTVLNSWWWTKRTSETCRVSLAGPCLIIQFK